MIYVYGVIVDKLREAAREYFLEDNPLRFISGGDQFAARFDYVYLGENQTPTQEEVGWWFYEISLNSQQKLHIFRRFFEKNEEL